jgi:hypothetical protein
VEGATTEAVAVGAMAEGSWRLWTADFKASTLDERVKHEEIGKAKEGRRRRRRRRVREEGKM